MSEDNSSEYNESYHAYQGPHSRRVTAILQDDEKDFWIHPVVPPQQMLRQARYSWYESVFNLVELQRYKAKMRIYPEAV